jgi:hypothetical protein
LRQQRKIDSEPAIDPVAGEEQIFLIIFILLFIFGFLLGYLYFCRADQLAV